MASVGEELGLPDWRRRNEEVTFPALDDGIKGMAFVEACVRSSNSGAAWVEV